MMNLLTNEVSSANKDLVRVIEPTANDQPKAYCSSASSTVISISPEPQLTLFGELIDPLSLVVGHQADRTLNHISALARPEIKPGEAPEVDFKVDINELASTRSRRKRNLETLWIANHRNELQKYEGEWIGLEGYELVAHSKDLNEVVRKLKEFGAAVPFTIFIPERRPGIFMGL